MAYSRQSTLYCRYIRISICNIFYLNLFYIHTCDSQRHRQLNGAGLPDVKRISHTVMTSPRWALIICFVPDNHRHRCSWRHLKWNFCDRCNFKHANFNLFLARLKAQRQRQKLNTRQYMYPTGNGKMCINNYIYFFYYHLSRSFCECNDPRPPSRGFGDKLMLTQGPFSISYLEAQVTWNFSF